MDKESKHSVSVGLSFGSTSAVITTLGLLVGLSSGTGSELAVIGGILIIAVADACSDALGIHVSEESEGTHTPGQIWTATAAAFAAKFFISISFVVPVLLLDMSIAVPLSIAWGLLLLGTLSYILALRQGASPVKVILEHVLIAVVVVAVSHFLGQWIRGTFGGLHG